MSVWAKRTPEQKEQMRKRKRERRAACKAAGLCMECQQPATRGLLCDTHAEQQRARQQAMNQRRHAAGTCVQCGQPVSGGVWRCPEHRDRHQEAIRRWYFNMTPAQYRAYRGRKLRSEQNQTMRSLYAQSEA